MIDYLIIRDEHRVQIGIIDLFNSVIWQRSYYGTGAFEIYCQATAEYVSMLKVGNFVTRDGDSEVGIIERIEKTFSATDGNMIIASGRFAKSILDRRLIYRLNGNSNKATLISGNVETAARKLVQDNIISASDSARNIAFLKLGAVAGITKRIVSENGLSGQKQTSYDVLLDYVDELLQEYECGCIMTLDKNKNLVFSVFEGEDKTIENTNGNRPVVFSQQFDNLLSSDYVREMLLYKNTVLVGGEGEGTARFYSLYGGGNSGIDRREMFVDGAGINKMWTDDEEVEHEYPDGEYAQMLNALAVQELAPLKLTDSFAGAVDVTNSQYIYKKDYDVGDLVTIRDSIIDIELHTRIAALTETQDESGYKVEIEFN